jgi:hypothetical protein
MGNYIVKYYIAMGVKMENESGILRFEENWVDDKIFGEIKDYYSNGVIRMYRCFDFEGNLRYVSKYDSLGVRIKQEGVILGQFLSEYHFDSIPTNKEITFKISVSTPPNINTKVFVGEMQNSDVINKVEIPIKSNVAIYHKVFEKKEEIIFVTIGKFIDNEMVVVQDSILTKIVAR